MTTCLPSGVTQTERTAELCPSSVRTCAHPARGSRTRAPSCPAVKNASEDRSICVHRRRNLVIGKNEKVKGRIGKTARAAATE
eukprot:1514799-Pleurochrysis_carterae.AAC.1